ncbi:poly(R)-hydroxyalkanoic acid synthase subunit PhaE [Dyella sp.]|jgi:hypothetical protein|uniref:poly(R)-hydroxyalkanoic acid synthase subunit PhaE n=1 Tax=Dyella sp. TaxID=1869338 RepID=UPI002D792803|nr:poly(R)-hydroxyalkanoic acid synthase subunit PhaE [Dyella sp.]HET6433961.1 poly(R)-hydroxyalkanoic acid synthase subunit PhaE [Dyella sp.]
MADQASEFIRQAQAMAQQSWEQWMRQLQQSPLPSASPFPGLGAAAGFPPMGAAFGSGAPGGSPMSDVLERSLSGIKGYLDWIQRAAATGQGNPMGADWQTQVQQLFGGAQPFGGIDSTAAQGFVQQWQAWLAAAAGAPGGAQWHKPPHMPAFGLQREQQEKQQALMAAMLDSAEQQRRYQALLLRALAQGLERLQDKLAAHSEPGRQIESLKALYDLWIDSAEEAYAEIALSGEFREVYGEMVNAQMLERQLMQQQLEEVCRQLGLPTRSEVDSLGKRLQEVRREQRAAGGGSLAGELASLRAELAALKKRVASGDGEIRSSQERPASAPAQVQQGVRRSRAASPAAAGKGGTSPRRSSAASKAPVQAAVGKKVAKAAAAPAPAPAPKQKAARAESSAKPARGKSRSKAASASAGGKASTSAKPAVLPGIPAPRRGKRK